MTNRIKELFEAATNKSIGLVICGWPGVGKSTLFKELKNSSVKVLDSDSSIFDKAHFPENYIKHIKESIATGNTILASSHDVVRDALIKQCIPFTLVYPDKSLKHEYIKRYKKRGSPDAFVKLLESKWDEWISQCDKLDNKLVTKVTLKEKEFISLNKVLSSIIQNCEDTKTQKEMINDFNKIIKITNLYKKSGTFQARKGIAGEHIVTTIDGEDETQKTVKDNEVVIKGPKGELYVVSENKFNERYEVNKKLTNEFQKYKALGMIRAFEYTGKPFKFIASWDEEMICKPGDYLACPILSKDDFKVTEVYRIERSVFDETYSLVNEDDKSGK